MINHNRPSLCATMYVVPFMSLGTIVPNWISVDVGEWVRLIVRLVQVRVNM